MPSRTGTGRRRWLRPPRRLRLLRAGLFLLVGIFGLGLATLNTGNNLLYLLLGALLGLIVLSGILSEETLRPLRVERRAPRAATVGVPAPIEYTLRHRGGRTPAFALHVGERGWGRAAFVPTVAPGGHAIVRLERTFGRRGVVPLHAVMVSTSFPFGLFLKQREYDQAGSIVVWPRTDRRIRAPRHGARRPRGTEGSTAAVAIGRALYRGLRAYRPGDEPRDVHWRSTARAGELIVREFEAEHADGQWIVLDVRGRDGDPAEEAAVEIAAALAARAAKFGERFALAAGEVRIPWGSGSAQLARTLDALAALHFAEDAPPPLPPEAGADCVLVSPRASTGVGFADVHAPEPE